MIQYCVGGLRVKGVLAGPKNAVAQNPVSKLKAASLTLPYPFKFIWPTSQSDYQIKKRFMLPVTSILTFGTQLEIGLSWTNW